MIRSFARFMGQCYKNRSILDVPIWHQVQDFLFFHRETLVAPLEFQLFRLWDRQRPIEDKLAYLSHEERRQIEAAVNPVPAVDALNDKKAAAERLRLAGVRMPRVLGYIETRNSDDIAKDASDLAAELAQLVGDGLAQGLVIKPNKGLGGKNVRIFAAANTNGVLRADGSQLSFAALASELIGTTVSGWNVEERLTPHPAVSRFAANSLSTLRVLTFRSPEGAILVGPITIKIPVDHNVVDNFGADNLAAPVHLITGRVGKAVKFNMERNISQHPTSGVSIDTLTVPDLELVTQLVTAAASEMKELGSLGWDVALTPDGPVILEGNAWWGQYLSQMPQGEGIVRGEFAAMLEAYGLGHLLRKRERAATAWKRNQDVQAI